MLIKRYNGPEKRNSSVEAVQTILSRKKSRAQIFSKNVENVFSLPWTKCSTKT